jgi:hypothetical protein
MDRSNKTVLESSSVNLLWFRVLTNDANVFNPNIMVDKISFPTISIPVLAMCLIPSQLPSCDATFALRRSTLLPAIFVAHRASKILCRVFNRNAVAYLDRASVDEIRIELRKLEDTLKAIGPKDYSNFVINSVNSLLVAFALGEHHLFDTVASEEDYLHKLKRIATRYELFAQKCAKLYISSLFCLLLSLSDEQVA